MDKLTAYVAKNRFNAAKEAEVLQKEVIETLVEDTIDDLVDDQKLDWIYELVLSMPHFKCRLQVEGFQKCKAAIIISL